jgi:hypothetical protein
LLAGDQSFPEETLMTIKRIHVIYAFLLLYAATGAVAIIGAFIA